MMAYLINVAWLKTDFVWSLLKGRKIRQGFLVLYDFY